jgi:tetratricopeptide (TPR) repeat protein
LDVHRAIDAGARNSGLAVLPVYIKREHDERLKGIVAQAVAGCSALVVLVGDSSTGKTRACWEALKALPAGWRLWHPIGLGRAEAAIEALPMVGPQTVVWLDDAQHYLLTPGTNAGSRVAAGLQALLRDPQRGQVLMLGTIWRKEWAVLTAPADGHEDPHAEARALLTGRGISVPERFDWSDLEAARQAGRSDPRLAEACAKAEDGQITQYLAGIPVLLERYHTAPSPAKALIEAAMDAYRLGHTRPLSISLLSAAVHGYLTGQQWDSLGENWLKEAVSYAVAPCRGIRGPLTLIHPRPGQAFPGEDRFRLSDSLEQLGHNTRRPVPVPAALWDALLCYGDRGNLVSIASRAESRSLYRYAAHLFHTAARAHQVEALREGARLIRQVTGNSDKAIAWLQAHAEAGTVHRSHRAIVASLWADAGRVDEAFAWYKEAAEDGDTWAAYHGVRLMREAGRAEEATAWLLHVDIEDNAPAARGQEQVAELMEEVGRIAEATRWYQQAVEAGNPNAMRDVSRLATKADSPAEVIEWMRRRAEANDSTAAKELGRLAEAKGRIVEALRWYQQAAETTHARGASTMGDWSVTYEVGRLAEEAGQTEKVLAWMRRLAETGSVDAIRAVRQLAKDTGRTADVLPWMQHLAETGSREALDEVALLAAGTGRTTEFIPWMQRLTGTHESGAVVWLAKFMLQAGRFEEAIPYCRQVAESDDPLLIWAIAHWLREAGLVDEAITHYRQAAEAVLDSPWVDASWAADYWMREMGRPEEVDTWLRDLAASGNVETLSRLIYLLRQSEPEQVVTWLLPLRIDPSDSKALMAAALVMRELGQVEKALAYYRMAAQAGDTRVPHQLGYLLETAGRLDEAISWYHRASDAGNTYALIWAADLLAEKAQVDEAIRLYVQAAEVGEADGLDRAAKLLARSGRKQDAEQLRRYGIEPGRIADSWECPESLWDATSVSRL